PFIDYSLCSARCAADHELHALPYTTLFRSSGRLARRMTLPLGTAAVPVRLRPLGPDTARLTLNARLALHLGDTGVLRDPERRSIDRKSTRLNSSHVKISYAVFCLEKKMANS